MKRDSALIHRILEYVEEQPKNCHIPTNGFDGCASAQVADHAKLCEEAGYLESTGSQYVNSDSLARATVYRLTWEGHEHLALLRSAGNTRPSKPSGVRASAREAVAS